ncbi:transposase [Salinibacillus xinjiangensis]|uniref:Transposase n=1 Tax=Salinibacillus xinjiangensis TaxID=1229268 RepID=A0A6G1X2D7_9BACI|nr:transposase [Salinibacillus xinjiangensis]MRG84988.1 transposase [Salinibacillus xinjiangensis]
MPRSARKRSRSGIYHIILRGVNQQTIFEDYQDKRRFLETLSRFKEISKYQIFSYCLMNNHVHLLIKEVEEEISLAMKRISSSYVFWYNEKYERSGHLFQERFKSESVESRDYFFTVLRYIHQNPLKAGLVKDVFSSRWTSVNEYIDHTNIIDIDFALNHISPDRKKAIEMYIEYMKQTNEDQCLEDRVRERRSDIEVREYLLQLGVFNTSSLQKMDKESRNAILTRLKTLNGVSIRQLARITGVSKSVIQRVQ